MEPKLMFSFTTPEAQMILDGLAYLPYRNVDYLIKRIQSEGDAQLQVLVNQQKADNASQPVEPIPIQN